MAKKNHWRAPKPRRGKAAFKVRDLVRYGDAGLVHEVVAVRVSECDARAPSGYVSTIVPRAAHLWQEVTP